VAGHHQVAWAGAEAFERILAVIGFFDPAVVPLEDAGEKFVDRGIGIHQEEAARAHEISMRLWAGTP
jgi:hypothetical protein